MKILRYFPILVLAAVIACNNKKKDTAGGQDISDSTVTAIVDSTGISVDVEKLKDELGKMIPLTKEELQILLPAELMGVPNAGVTVSDGLGTLSASTDYKINDSTSIRVEIVDCAGSGGVGFFSMQYESMMEPEEADSETTYKVTDFKGHKASESCLKSDPGSCIFTFFSGKRFLVSVESRTAGIDALKQVAGGLDIK
jgi:hypothetical protein